MYELAQCAVARYFAAAFPAGSRVFDAGAGSGRALTALLSAGYDGYGIDPSDPLRQAPVDQPPALADRLTAGALPERARRSVAHSTAVASGHFVIDHAIPFAFWGNNDLWNLLPADAAVNGQKSDKLPRPDLLMGPGPMS